MEKLRQVCRSGNDIKVAEAEKQQRGGKNAEQEVLDSGLLGLLVHFGQIEQYIGGDAAEFRAEEQRNQLVGGARQRHTGDQHEKTGEKIGRLLVLQVVQAEQHVSRAAPQRQPLPDGG